MKNNFMQTDDYFYCDRCLNKNKGICPYEYIRENNLSISECLNYIPTIVESKLTTYDYEVLDNEKIKCKYIKDMITNFYIEITNIIINIIKSIRFIG